MTKKEHNRILVAVKRQAELWEKAYTYERASELPRWVTRVSFYVQHHEGGAHINVYISSDTFLVAKFSAYAYEIWDEQGLEREAHSKPGSLQEAIYKELISALKGAYES